MVDIHFHPVRRTRSLFHRQHGHHHFGYYRRNYTVIDCGNSIICKVFFGLIILAMIIGFIVVVIKGSFTKKNTHYTNYNTNSDNKSQNKK